MEAYRTYKNGEYREWKFPKAGTLAEKLSIQRKVKAAMELLRPLKLEWYAVEGEPGKAYKEEYSRLFTVHKRRGYEIHELNMGVL